MYLLCKRFLLHYTRRGSPDRASWEVALQARGRRFDPGWLHSRNLCNCRSFRLPGPGKAKVGVYAQKIRYVGGRGNGGPARRRVRRTIALTGNDSPQLAVGTPHDGCT